MSTEDDVSQVRRYAHTLVVVHHAVVVFIGCKVGIDGVVTAEVTVDQDGLWRLFGLENVLNIAGRVEAA